MPNPSLTLWIDSNTGTLLSGWQSLSSASQPVLKQGDNIGVELHWVSNFQGGAMTELEFPVSATMALAIGRLDTAPTAGSFTLTYGGFTTGVLAYNATATEVQTALNALSSIASDGGVTVSAVTTTYRIVWNSKVVPSSTLSIGSNELYPSCSTGINNVKTGSLTQKQIYQLHIKQSPIANVTSFVNQDAAVISVSVIHASAFSGDSKVWRATIAPEPRDGSFLLSFQIGSTTYTTDPISIFATSSEVADLLNAKSNQLWSCVKTGSYSWDISTTSTTVVSLSASGAGIISFNSKYGVLSLNTAEVEDFLAGNVSDTAYMEVELDSSGTKKTILQTQVSVNNDLIDNDTYTTVTWGSVLPADSVVRYDTSQSLTSPQKAQARTNIGAIDSSVITPLTAKDVNLEGRIVTLEASTLSTNTVNGLDTTTPLSSTNKVIDAASLTTALATKANVSHTHTISDITSLSTELTNKADASHTHSSFSNLTISTSITAPAFTLASSTVINDVTFLKGAGTQANTQTGITTTIYNTEIVVYVNGVRFAVPARAF